MTLLGTEPRHRRSLLLIRFTSASTWVSQTRGAHGLPGLQRALSVGDPSAAAFRNPLEKRE